MRTPRFKRIGLKAVGMDMWPAFIKAVSKNYPEQLIAFDRYRLIKVNRFRWWFFQQFLRGRLTEPYILLVPERPQQIPSGCKDR